MTCSANLRRLSSTALILLALTPAALAHDVWINREQHRNTAGEWCCNAADCSPLAQEKVQVTPRGYLLETGETIPHSNAAMSGDGQYWQCRRPDKSTRCFFFPPPGM